MRSRSRNETLRSGRDEKRQPGLGCRGVETATEQIDSRCLGCGRFFRRLDVNMGEAAFTFELTQVVNGVFFVGSQHGWTLVNRLQCGKTEMAEKKGVGLTKITIL